jgi:uncharacterized membrane protein
MLTFLDDWQSGVISVLGAAPVRGLVVSARYYYLGLAILMVLLLVALVKAYRTWEEIHEDEEPDSSRDLLEKFVEAHAAGEMDDEEFERVRQRLGGPSTDTNPKPPAAAREEELG